MGWKNVKDHYRIGHIVQIRSGFIAIGSAYVPDLIRVSMDGKPSWGNLGPSDNRDLSRYYAEMQKDLPKLAQLVQSPDSFSQSLPVFTWSSGVILEKECEAYGWPNVTHDGMIQYENTFSSDRMQVVRWAKQDALYGIKCMLRRRREIKKQAEEIEAYHDEYVSALAALDHDYPEIKVEIESSDE